MKKIYYEKSYHTNRHSFTVIPLFFLVFILIIISLTLFYFHRTNREEAQASEIPAPTATPFPTVSDNLLAKSVETPLRGVRDNYGIVVRNLDNGETYKFNEHVVYDTASLYKLWVMAVVYRQIQEGKLKESTILSGNIVDLNNMFGIADESAELNEGSLTITVSDALTKMITISDNYSALLLTQKIGVNSITEYLKENGFFETVIGRNTNTPTTTPYDVSLFFEKLYKGELANQEDTGKMLTLLKAQQRNTKIPKLLPSDTVVAHKTGELDEYSHDAGLVLNSNGNFIIVIMSKTDNPDKAVAEISAISKSVFDNYISKQKSNP